MSFDIVYGHFVNLRKENTSNTITGRVREKHCYTLFTVLAFDPRLLCSYTHTLVQGFLHWQVECLLIKSLLQTTLVLLLLQEAMPPAKCSKNRQKLQYCNYVAAVASQF